MTFLIFKIFIYLVLAAGVGIGAGWLIRNLQAQKTDEAAQRAVHDAKSKLPQLESHIRSRDDKATKLKGELNDAKTLAKESRTQVRQLEQELRDAEREAKRWKQSAEASKSARATTSLELDFADDELSNGTNHANKQEEVAPAGHGDDQIVVELTQEIARLKAELKTAQEAASDAAAEFQRVQNQAVTSREQDPSLNKVEFEALQLQLSTTERKLMATGNELKLERDKVIELERERELQNKSLQVLHQQLELERSRRVANG